LLHFYGLHLVNLLFILATIRGITIIIIITTTTIIIIITIIIITIIIIIITTIATKISNVCFSNWFGGYYCVIIGGLLIILAFQYKGKDFYSEFHSTLHVAISSGIVTGSLWQVYVNFCMMKNYNLMKLFGL